MTGWHLNPAGPKVSARVKFTPTEGGQLKHLIEHSAHSGETWTTYFDGTYVQRS